MSVWEQVSLNKLGILEKGIQKHHPQYDTCLFEGGSVPFLQTLNCQNDKLHPIELTKYYNKLGILQSKQFKKDTVCITNHGRIGDAVILKNPTCLSAHLFGFNSFKNVSDPKFIKYCFNYSKIKKLCNVISSAVSATKELTLDRILKIPFPNPPFELQQKIGKILSTYDLLIENYQRQIEEAKKQ
ncbi:hypothetical protein A6V39_05655, partial [Candidatus Mycoplasma haematobovis]